MSAGEKKFLGAVVIVALLAIVALFAWHYWPEPPKRVVTQTNVITNVVTKTVEMTKTVFSTNEIMMPMMVTRPEYITNVIPVVVTVTATNYSTNTVKITNTVTSTVTVTNAPDTNATKTSSGMVLDIADAKAFTHKNNTNGMPDGLDMVFVNGHDQTIKVFVNPKDGPGTIVQILQPGTTHFPMAAGAYPYASTTHDSNDKREFVVHTNACCFMTGVGWCNGLLVFEPSRR